MTGGALGYLHLGDELRPVASTADWLLAAVSGAGTQWPVRPMTGLRPERSFGSR